MAKCHIERQEIKVILELTQDEAEILLAVTNHISGPPGGSRKHMSAIGYALTNNGLNSRIDVIGHIHEIELI